MKINSRKILDLRKIESLLRFQIVAEKGMPKMAQPKMARFVIAEKKRN
jgi:hypothetical protein